jgi:hypothetical protein
MPDGIQQKEQGSHLVEFLGFQFLGMILGLGIRALTFFVTFLCQDKKVKQG